MLDIRVHEGRGFITRNARLTPGVAVVSETVARQLWPAAQTLDETLRLEDAELARAEIVPPVRHVHRRSASSRRAGLRDSPTGRSPACTCRPAQTPRTTLTLRVHGNPDQARVGAVRSAHGHRPAIDDIRTLRIVAGLETYLLGNRLLGCSRARRPGARVHVVRSLQRALVRRRAAPQGNRRAHGARRHDAECHRLVLSHLLRLVGLGLAPAAAWRRAGDVICARRRPRRSSRGVVDVFDPVAYLGSTLCIVIARLLAAWLPARRGSTPSRRCDRAEIGQGYA